MIIPQDQSAHLTECLLYIPLLNWSKKTIKLPNTNLDHALIGWHEFIFVLQKDMVERHF